MLPRSAAASVSITLTACAAAERDTHAKARGGVGTGTHTSLSGPGRFRPLRAGRFGAERKCAPPAQQPQSSSALPRTLPTQSSLRGPRPAREAAWRMKSKRRAGQPGGAVGCETCSCDGDACARCNPRPARLLLARREEAPDRLPLVVVAAPRHSAPMGFHIRIDGAASAMPRKAQGSRQGGARSPPPELPIPSPRAPDLVCEAPHRLVCL